MAVHAFNASLELLWSGGNCVGNHRRESRKTVKVSDTEDYGGARREKLHKKMHPIGKKYC